MLAAVTPHSALTRGVLQPFIAEGSALERAFPPKALATAVPIYAGLLLLSIIVFNVGWSLVSAHPVFQRSKNKEWHEKNS